VQGSLGATALGDPVLDRLDFASISPAGNSAIGCHRAECFVVGDLSDPRQTTLPLTSVPEGVAWAADGSGAVLYSRTAGWLQNLTGLASSPDLSQRWTVPGPGPLLAITFDGRRTVISVGGESGGIFEVTTEGGLVRLADAPNAVALITKSDTVYALDGA
jgi:hypothetical protein